MPEVQYYLGKQPLYTQDDLDREIAKQTAALREEISRLRAPMSDVIPLDPTANRDIAQMESEIGELRRIAQFLGNGDLLYHLRKYAAAYHAVLTHYAKFKVGDRVQLAKTPNINEQNAPGWLGSKHFLVKGARGTVVSADFSIGGSGALRYGIQFDDESWLHPIDKTTVLVEPDRRHEYSFGEEWLEPQRT